MLRRFKLKRKKKEKENGGTEVGEKEGERKQELESGTSSPPLAPSLNMACGSPTYKVILCGEYGVGKSSIFRRFLDGSFIPPSPSSPNSTLGQDQCTRDFTVGDTPVKLTMWDTGGMERMSFIGASYYRGAQAALLCYNTNNKDTFTILSQYILDIAMNAEGAKIFLCGNDAIGGEGKDKVQESDMDAFMSEGGDMLSGVYTVSCRENTGLDHMFRDIARVLHTDAMQRRTLRRDVVPPGETVKLEIEEERSKCSC